jgi:hypothetical protein
LRRHDYHHHRRSGHVNDHDYCRPGHVNYNFVYDHDRRPVLRVAMAIGAMGADQPAL